MSRFAAGKTGGKDHSGPLLLVGRRGVSFFVLVLLGLFCAFLFFLADVRGAGSSLVPVRGSRSIAVSGTCWRGLTLTLGTGTQCRYQRETKHENHSLHCV